MILFDESKKERFVHHPGTGEPLVRAIAGEDPVRFQISDRKLEKGPDMRDDEKTDLGPGEADTSDAISDRMMEQRGASARGNPINASVSSDRRAQARRRRTRFVFRAVRGEGSTSILGVVCACPRGQDVQHPKC
jgi:hypothetical protein